VERGYIKLSRRLLDNQMWCAESFTRGQAWVDMLLLANHKDGYILKRGIEVKVQRGQIGWSELALAKRWGWSRGKIRRFFETLVRKEKIVQQKTNITTLNEIVNYNLYQAGGTPSGTPNGHQTDTKRYTNKNDKKGKKEKNKRYTSDFETFWKAYPEKIGKQPSWEKWQKINNSRPPLETILKAIEKQKQSDKWKNGFIPNPLTWLNQARWEDETKEIIGDGSIYDRLIAANEKADAVVQQEGSHTGPA